MAGEGEGGGFLKLLLAAVQQGVHPPCSCWLVLKYGVPVEDMLHCLEELGTVCVWGGGGEREGGGAIHQPCSCWLVLKYGIPVEDMLCCLEELGTLCVWVGGGGGGEEWIPPEVFTPAHLDFPVDLCGQLGHVCL